MLLKLRARLLTLRAIVEFREIWNRKYSELASMLN
jgi:hypothetical protein